MIGEETIEHFQINRRLAPALLGAFRLPRRV